MCIRDRDLTLHQLVHTLYERGLEVVRVDTDRMRIMSGGTSLPGIHCLTLRDTKGAVLVLGKSVLNTSPDLWSVHAFEVSNEAQVAGRPHFTPILPASVTSNDAPHQADDPAGTGQISPLDPVSLVVDAFQHAGIYT